MYNKNEEREGVVRFNKGTKMRDREQKTKTERIEEVEEREEKLNDSKFLCAKEGERM